MIWSPTFGITTSPKAASGASASHCLAANEVGENRTNEATLDWKVGLKSDESHPGDQSTEEQIARNLRGTVEDADQAVKRHAAHFNHGDGCAGWKAALLHSIARHLGDEQSGRLVL
ncbi:MAG: hypothetical protein U0V70_00285 [Terriglobia bacterium]